MAVVDIRNLTYEYIRRDENDKIIATTTALKNINLQINEGEFVAVIGHNGSGKSTLARLINGLIMPSSGRVLVQGMDTRDKDKIWDIRRNAGMVFQNPDNQIIASVVDEEVAFGPENLGVPSGEIRERVREALRTVGMSDYANASPARLSGGQKQRIAIAGALAMMPRCIIFDEATAMLDPIGRLEVTAVASRLAREKGITVIFITHYMEEAAMADRVIALSGGEVVMDDTPRAVFAREEELASIGLDIPEVTKLAKKLYKAGRISSPNIISESELIAAIAGR